MPTTPRGLLFDLDGVLYNATQPIEGAAKAIEWVVANRIPHLFVTNTTSRSRQALAEKLIAFGIHSVQPHQIITPAVAAAEWLRHQQHRRIALFVRDEARPEFEGLEDVHEDADYVVIGDLGEQWNYQTLNRAFRLLHANPKAELIALGMTRYWKTDDGISLDVAPFVAALECATGRKALVLGKPAANFFQAAVERLSIPPTHVLMIGDDIETDIGGAQQAGLKGMLVRTGKFRQQDLESSVIPDAVVDSVAGLPTWWPTKTE